jgi:DNA-binding PadR family transcriptional regulator
MTTYAAEGFGEGRGWGERGRGKRERRHPRRPHKAGKALLGAAVLRAMSEGRKRHRGGPGRGGPGFGGPGFGPGFDPRMFAFGAMRGFGPHGRGGRRVRRGDVRAAALLLLEEEPRNGYQLMQEIEARSGGVWRPSPGSIYPALSQLEDEGLVRSDEAAGRRAFQLTDEGRAYVEEHRQALGVPWESAGDDISETAMTLRGLMMQLGMATMQVVQAGDDDQAAEARKVLEDARRALYRILAGDEPTE